MLLVQDFNNLLTENDSYRTENQNFRIQTAQLGEKIDFLESMAHKLSIVSGMSAEKGVGGVGGFSRESLSQPWTASAGTLRSFDGYNKSVSALESRFRRVGSLISRNVLLASAMPDRMPVRGYVSGAMGLRENPFNGSTIERHTGLDISAPTGTPVRAPADGVVIFAGQREGYGNIVVIDHKFGVVTRYGHLSKINAEIGHRVTRSEVIGYVGTTGRTTGPHLHYEVWVHNVRKDPRQFFTHSGIE
jgi:murein DD-endopeptidase MepM/ murein hydrolase activator NlpD